MVVARLKIRRLRRLLARHRSLLYIESAAFWCIFLVALFYAVSFFIVPMIAEAKLEKACGGVVDIESGRFAGFGAIRLNGLVIKSNDVEPSEAPILHADRVDVQFNIWRLLTGRFKVYSINLSDFLLTADYDLQSRRWNLQELSLGSEAASTKGRSPLLIIDKGALRLRLKDPNGIKRLTIVSIKGQIAQKTGPYEYGFSLQTDGRFGYGPSRLQGGIRIGQNGTQNQFWATGNIDMPTRGILGNQWDLRDITLNASFDKKTIAVTRFGFSLGSGDANIFGLFHRNDSCNMDLNVSLQNFQISDKSVPNAFVYGQFYEFLGAGENSFFRRFHPVGTGNVGSDQQPFTIKTSLRDFSTAQLNGVIHCSDVAIKDRRFPYLLEELAGDIRFTDRTLELLDLNARHDDMEFTLSGTIGNIGLRPDTDIHIQSPNMKFDKDLFMALSDPIKQVWYEFSPKGRMGVNYRFQKSSEGQKQTHITLDLKGIEALYRHFPYPLENLTGQVIIDSGTLELQDLIAVYPDGRQVNISGKVFPTEDKKPNFRVDVMAESIPVDQTLISALPPKQQVLFDSLDIEAVADVNVMVFPNMTESRNLDYAADISVRADWLLHAGFPLPMQDVKLTATVTPDVMLLDHFQAVTAGGTIHLKESKLFPQGQDPGRPGYCLDLDLKNFELNQDFWKTAGVNARQMLSAFQVFGMIDAVGLMEVNLPTKYCKGTDLEIKCRDDRLTWSGKDLGRMQGGLHVKDSKVHFEKFVFDDVLLEALPIELMNDKTQSFYAWSQPQGRADVRIEEGFLQINHNRLVQIDVCAAMDLQGVSCGRSNALQRLDGTCTGQFEVDVDLTRWQTELSYQIENLQYRNWLATNLSGTLHYDPDQMILKSEDMNADFYKGTVQGHCKVDLNPESKAGYELGVDCDSVDLQSLLTAVRQRSPEQMAQGRVVGSLGLGGAFDELSASEGNLDVKIVDLRIGQQSLFGKILTAVQLKRPENYVFSQIQLRADIQGPQMSFNRIRMVGSPLIFDGTGQFNLSSREVNAQLSAWDRIVTDRDNILDTLARGVGSALWRVELAGTLDDPKVDAVYLSVLKQPLDIFKKNE